MSGRPGQGRGRRRSESDGLSITQGAIFGAAAYVVGYVLTFVLFELDGEFDASGLEDIGAGTMEAVGWVFYSAQRIDIERTMEGGGGSESETANVIAETSTDLPELLYYLVPVAVLIGIGYLLVDRVYAAESADAAKIGGSVVAGYLPLTIVGVFLFEASEEATVLGESFSVSMGPELVPAVVIMGVLYPAVLGATGGYLNHATDQ